MSTKKAALKISGTMSQKTFQNLENTKMWKNMKVYRNMFLLM